MINKRNIRYVVVSAVILVCLGFAGLIWTALQGVGELSEQSNKHRETAGAGINEMLLQESATAAPDRFDREDNGVWMRRHWIHGGAELDHAELAKSLEELGIRRIYPFLGPMDKDGKPGWRDDGEIRHYQPERARAFFAEMERLAPDVQIVPWSGGVLERDVRPEDPAQRAAYAREVAKFVELGADGIHINIEPMPSHRPGYLDLLREVKAAIGPDKIVSIAAYPPTTPLHPFPEVHWTLEFTREACQAADELVVMGYDTALRDTAKYEGLMADWTADLLTTVQSPDQGGCELLMGVPAYEDDKGYHRPDVETIEHGINGVKQGLARLDEVPDHFRGVAVYSSWTTDAEEWIAYQKLWRGNEHEGVVLPDYNL